MHPLFLLYLNHDTYDALQIFQAGYKAGTLKPQE
jgi:hypothetical protein